MKSSLYRKYYKIIFYLSPLLLILLMIFFYWNSYSEENIFPDPNLEVIPYCDKDNNGGSSSVYIIEESINRIQFSYTLKRGFINPFAGVQLDFDESKDFTGGQELIFNIRATNSESIKIVLLTEVSGYTKKQNTLSYLHLQREIPVNPESSEVRLKLSELYTPEWWFESEIREEDWRYQKDFSRVRSLLIQSSTNKQSDIQDIITITNITLISSNPLIFPGFSLGIILNLVIILVWLWIQKTKERINKQNQFPTNPLVFGSTEKIPSAELLKIIEYIGHNYSNADLKLYMVNQACDVPENQISQLLKSHFQLSFLQYLNMIRLTEAKRLLLESDLRIFEIASKTGFNSLSHFTRSFKNIEQMSPSEFRKLKKSEG